MVNILDFNNNGGAIIEIPQIDDDYSLVVNHWKSVDIELQKIEQDILQSDSPQRTSFLKKYAEEMQKYTGCEDVISNKFCKYSFEEYEYESEEERLFYEEEKNIDCKEIYLEIYNFELKHSLAWYLMNQLDIEIEKLKQKIEIQKGLQKVFSSIDDTIRIIRKTEEEYQVTVELMKHFALSKMQAKAAIDLTLSELINGTQEQTESKIKFLEFFISFLGKMKE